MTITVYLGDTLHWSNAKNVLLTMGEERCDIDVSVPISDLHTIAGTVEAKTDGHRITTGIVNPDGVDDLNLARSAPIYDGAFAFDLVPTGNYTLSTHGARDTRGRLAQAEGRTIFVLDNLPSFRPARRSLALQTTYIIGLVL